MLFSLQLYPLKLQLRIQAAPSSTQPSREEFALLAWAQPLLITLRGGEGRLGCGGSGLPPNLRALFLQASFCRALSVRECIAREKILSHLKENFPLLKENSHESSLVFNLFRGL